MLNVTEVFNKLIPIFKSVFDDIDLVIDETTKAEDIDEWDSLTHIRLVVSIEKKFDQ